MGDNKETSSETTTPPQQQQQHIILFYKYHPLSEDRSVVARYQHALENLCVALDLRGRILVGCSKTEGVNGTLAGRHGNVLAFTRTLLREDVETDDRRNDDDSHLFADAIQQFRRESKAFFDSIGESELRFDSPDDFKWSCCVCPKEELFPDLNIKLTAELIGTGGVLSSISLEETTLGYLTPKEWHERLQQMKDNDNYNDTLLIDCRNTKEYEIGHFVGATDPNTTTFAQFPKWCDDHKHLLAAKSQILMYCTGGIRCEKASAYIRKAVPGVKSVHHLKGGIHKYLEEFGGSGDSNAAAYAADGNDSLWKGRNFVFDGRGGATGEETKLGKEGRALDGDTKQAGCPAPIPEVVGRCVACDGPFDSFNPHCVCTVCREPTLVCPDCQEHLVEYHCRNHDHLRSCYFSDLIRFSRMELEEQLCQLNELLEEIAVGRRFRQKRKTILKQIGRVQARLDEVVLCGEEPLKSDSVNQTTKCRNCGEEYCSGRCWGFYGLKRKEILGKQKDDAASSALPSVKSNVSSRKPAQLLKRPRRDDGKLEIAQLNASLPPNEYRDLESGIRVPPCCTRLLQCTMKAKWCGQSLITVVQNEFEELSRPEVLRDVLANGLLKLNGKTVSDWELSDRQLKSSDTIGRVIHWHEAPVQVPARIGVERVKLPAAVVEALGTSVGDAYLYVCNKPSSVPVHPAGPYLANTLTLMVEAQEGLSPQSLKPLHRTDRVTSGLTLCCTSSALTALFHKSIGEAGVDKLYLARIHGKFPSTGSDTDAIQQSNFSSGIAKFAWVEEGRHLRIDAPVHTVDPAAGLRTVDLAGKQSQSLFRRLAYDERSDTSVLACFPVTGRNHQLRVHLQFLGFPIVNDFQYGGRSETDQTELTEDSPVVKMMMTAKQEDERRVESLSDSDVQAAKRACPCCTIGPEGILKSFTARQLLMGGHAIHLHALRYRIRIRLNNKKSKHNANVPQGDDAQQLLLEVEPPEWAEKHALKELDWLV